MFWIRCTRTSLIFRERPKLRRQRLEEGVTDFFLDLETFGEERPSDAPSLDECIDRGRQLERLYDAMDALGGGQRELLNLYYFQEYSVGEMANLLGKSPSAIKMGLLRGRNRILQLLADNASSDD